MKIPSLHRTKAKWLVAVAAALFGVASQAAEITYQGIAKVERFDNVTGGLNGLIGNAKYTGNQPDDIKFLENGLFYDLEGALDNFGARITGWITPTEEADYVFYVSADDSCAFYLSTDADPANLKLIAADVGWQGTRVWTGPGGSDAAQNPPFRRGIRATGEPPYENRSDMFLQSPQNALLDTGAPRWPTLDTEGRPIIHLQAGVSYAFRFNFVEGTGGAHAEVAMSPVGIEPENGVAGTEIPASVLSTRYTDTLSFITQPSSVSTFEGQVVNFTSRAIGFPGGVAYQWNVDGQPIDGAVEATYQIPAATVVDHNGKVYTVTITSIADGSKTLTSQPATLTVSTDTVGPKILRVRSSEDLKTVRVVYDESVSDEAITAGNYVFNPPLTVEDANFDVDIVAEFAIARDPADDPKAPNDPRKRLSVLLTVSGMVTNTTYTLTVSNVKDLAGNALNPNTKTMTSPVFMSGVLNYKRWIAGNNVVALRDDPYRFSNPSVQNTLTIAETASFDARPASYTDRVSGYFIPPADGDYVFHMSADNDGFLYLSTDADPANLKLIAADVGWQNARLWTGSGVADTPRRRGDGAGNGPFENRSDQFLTSQRVVGRAEGVTTGPTEGQGLPGGVPIEDGADPEPWPTRDTAGNAVITLVGGNRYYFELYHQEGDGGRVEATYRLASAAEPANGTASTLTGNVIGALVDPSSLLPTISAHPSPTVQNFTAGGTITFSVTANSSQPLTYQWYKDGVAIAGQTSSTLTINNATSADVGSYYVAVTNENGTVNSNQALALTPFTAPGLTFKQDANGLVSIEAEHYFDSLVAGDGHVWIPRSARAGASGSSYMQALPDSGVNSGTVSETIARLDYKIEFNKTGTHYIWLRGGDPRGDGAGDSVHGGIDGVNPATATRIDGAPGFNIATGWNWVGAIQGNARATVEVATVGIHTFNVWMREDGFSVDKIILTTDQAFTPTGAGPAESEQAGGATPTISVSRNASGVVTITYTGTLVSSATVNGTYTPVAGASGGTYTVPAGTTMAFFRSQQ